MTMTKSEIMPSKRSELTSAEIFSSESKAAQKLRQKLVADGLDKFTKAQNDRWRVERQWYLNLAFYYGRQYVQFRSIDSSRNFDLWVPPAPYYRVRPVINQVRKVVRKEISRLTSQQPNAYVIPSSTEDRDVFAAQAGEQIWSSLWRQHRFNRKVRQAVFWMSVCGNSYLKQYWDETKIDKINGMYGDISIEAITPFHILVPDLKEEDLEDQPCIIHAQVQQRDWIRNYWGVDPAESGRLDIVDESLLNVMGINHQARKDIAIVLEVWVKPGYTNELPNGGMYTIVANQIVQGFEGWPYSHEQYPFSKVDAIPTGKFYNDSIVNDLIPLQRELNRKRGQIIEAANKMGKPQLVAEEGSVDPSKITSEPGQAILYKMGMNPPQPLPLQDLPSYVTEEVNRLYSDIADISGIHEVSQGKTPPGVTAAVAISYLQEQDESMVSTHYDSLEEAIEKTAAQCLNYVKDYWDEPRTIRLVGVDAAFDVQTFKGSDLRGNTDIRVEAGSALPTSRAAKQAYITDLMKMGFIDPQEGLEVLEIGGLNKIYERVQVDTRQAQRENLKMRVVTPDDVEKHREAWEQQPDAVKVDPDTQQQLQPPLIIPVNTYDNHQIHIEIHNRYRKSQSFEMASPLTKMIFEEHVKQHMEATMVGQVAEVPGEMANPLEQPPEGPQGPPPPEQEQQMGMEQQQVQGGQLY